MPVSRHLIGAILVGTLGLSAVKPLGAAESPPDQPPRLASEQDGPPMARARIILGSNGMLPNGTYLAGLEVDLEDGWFTYWRSPGEAGAPAALTWDESVNVSELRMLWPAPKRRTIEGLTVNGYDRDTIFPLIIRPETPGEDLEIQLSLAYAACKDVCVPATANLQVTIPGLPEPPSLTAGMAQMAGQIDSMELWAEAIEGWARSFDENMAQIGQWTETVLAVQAEAIEQALASVPEPVESGAETPRALVIEGEGGRIVTLELDARWSLIDPQVFVEGPNRIVFGEVKVDTDAKGRRIIILAPIIRAGEAPLDGQDLKVTIVDRNGAYEETVRVIKRERIKQVPAEDADRLPRPYGPSTPTQDQKPE